MNRHSLLLSVGAFASSEQGGEEDRALPPGTYTGYTVTLVFYQELMNSGKRQKFISFSEFMNS